MTSQKTSPAGRRLPLRYDDGFRGMIAMAVSLPFMAVPFLLYLLAPDHVGIGPLMGGVGASLTIFSLVYIVWTHRLFSRLPFAESYRIAAEQYRRGPSRSAEFFGFGGAENWAVTEAAAALIVAIGTAIAWYSERALWLPVIALATAAASWATMAYAFALKYFRLHAAGERIEFDIQEPPVFTDFLSFAVMVSAVGALSGGTPRTRAVLDTVRTHTFLSFAFNSLVIAMTVSLVVGLVGGA